MEAPNLVGDSRDWPVRSRHSILCGPNVNGQLAGNYSGEGPEAEKKAIEKAAYATALNAFTYLKDMEDQDCFKKMTPDFQEDAIKALKNQRFDLEDGETTRGHLSSVTVASPPGTRVKVDAQGVEHWEYRHVSGEWRPAEGPRRRREGRRQLRPRRHRKTERIQIGFRGAEESPEQGERRPGRRAAELLFRC